MASDDKVFGNNPFLKFYTFLEEAVTKPTTWVRKNIVEPNRRQYYWYHEKFPRVPTVDECLIDDNVCIYEAEQQYFREMRVDENILEILKKRVEYCTVENAREPEVCRGVFDYYQNAATNFFIKYGDLGLRDTPIACYMKQKHRMAWERRHGPVGTGKRPKKEDYPFKVKQSED